MHRSAFNIKIDLDKYFSLAFVNVKMDNKMKRTSEQTNEQLRQEIKTNKWTTTWSLTKIGTYLHLIVSLANSTQLKVLGLQNARNIYTKIELNVRNTYVLWTAILMCIQCSWNGVCTQLCAPASKKKERKRKRDEWKINVCQLITVFDIKVHKSHSHRTLAQFISYSQLTTGTSRISTWYAFSFILLRSTKTFVLLTVGSMLADILRYRLADFERRLILHEYRNTIYCLNWSSLGSSTMYRR